jgi:hypothetical protein
LNVIYTPNSIVRPLKLGRIDVPLVTMTDGGILPTLMNVWSIQCPIVLPINPPLMLVMDVTQASSYQEMIVLPLLPCIV